MLSPQMKIREIRRTLSSQMFILDEEFASELVNLRCHWHPQAQTELASEWKCQ
jgi:hypothetical protein